MKYDGKERKLFTKPQSLNKKEPLGSSLLVLSEMMFSVLSVSVMVPQHGVDVLRYTY